MQITKILLSAVSFAAFGLTFFACNNAAVSNNTAANNAANKSNTATVTNSNQTASNVNVVNNTNSVSNTTANSVHSKTEKYTPEKDSPERTAIMDALRVPVGKELRQDVIFTVRTLNVQGDWAFFSGEPKAKEGGDVNWKITKYQEFIDNGDFESGLYALLKKTDGKWSVTTYLMNCHDVCYLGWDKEFKAPKAIFE